MRKINIPKSVLETHIKNNLSTDQIAAMYNCHKTTIKNYAKSYKLEIKDIKPRRVVRHHDAPEDIDFTLKVGDTLKIDNRQGKVCELSKKLFVVDFRLYKESFMYVDYKYKIGIFSGIARGYYRGNNLMLQEA